MKKLTKEQIKKINTMLEESECVILATDKGNVQIGMKNEIMSCYTMLIQALREKCDFKEENFKLCYKLSKLSNKEVDEEIKKALNSLLDDLKKLIKDDKN